MAVPLNSLSYSIFLKGSEIGINSVSMYPRNGGVSSFAQPCSKSMTAPPALKVQSTDITSAIPKCSHFKHEGEWLQISVSCVCVWGRGHDNH